MRENVQQFRLQGYMQFVLEIMHYFLSVEIVLGVTKSGPSVVVESVPLTVARVN